MTLIQGVWLLIVSLTLLILIKEQKYLKFGKYHQIVRDLEFAENFSEIIEILCDYGYIHTKIQKDGSLLMHDQANDFYVKAYIDGSILKVYVGITYFEKIVIYNCYRNKYNFEETDVIGYSLVATNVDDILQHFLQNKRVVYQNSERINDDLVYEYYGLEDKATINIAKGDFYRNVIIHTNNLQFQVSKPY